MMFRMHIFTGNDAMRTTGDIAEALRDIASQLDGPEDPIYWRDTPKIIRDRNGNEVGRFVFEDVTP